MTRLEGEKNKSPDIIESANSMRNIPDSYTCARGPVGEKKHIYVYKNTKTCPVIFFYYILAVKSQTPSDGFNTPSLGLPCLPQAEIFLLKQKENDETGRVKNLTRWVVKS